jgi:hypothetical protein
VAATDLRPAGTALIGRERVDVVTEGPWIEVNTPIQVVRAESYRHVVRVLESPGLDGGSGTAPPDSGPAVASDPAEAGSEGTADAG